MAPPLVVHDPATESGRAALRRALAAGRLAALPTDTVPGLGLLADAPDAAARLADAKGARADRPFSLHLRSEEDLRRLLPALPPGLPSWLAARLPGPWTIVLPRDWVGLPAAWGWAWPTVGLRLPDHSAYLRLARELPAPLLLSSINPSGEPPLAGAELRRWLEERPEIACGIDPEAVPAEARPSTVAAFDPLPRLLRGPRPEGGLRPGLRLLVVCTGNICRSPLAAALLERELAAAWGVQPADLQELGWIVASAGTFAVSGTPASEHSQTAATEIGLDLGRHRARHVEELAGRPWDRVLALAGSHLAALPPALRARAELLDPGGAEIPDPFGADLAAYRRMRERVEAAVAERIRRWSAWP
ncbi:MAG: hypothetical protein D6702_10165 [Planctomycetota bacterium]|nr:MAG: hypothetical protein D6702_10165 [Planctomycetota bacterium]